MKIVNLLTKIYNRYIKHKSELIDRINWIDQTANLRTFKVRMFFLSEAKLDNKKDRNNSFLK